MSTGFDLGDWGAPSPQPRPAAATPSPPAPPGISLRPAPSATIGPATTSTPTGPQPAVSTGRPAPQPVPGGPSAPLPPQPKPQAQDGALHLAPVLPSSPHAPAPLRVRPDAKTAEAELHGMLRWIVENDASDLLLASGATPRVRIHGRWQEMDGVPAIADGRLAAMLEVMANERQLARFNETGDVDLAYQIGDFSRYRVNLMRQQGRAATVIRTIPSQVRSVEEMDVPSQICDLANLPNGLVLVCGPTGTGKSTLLASLVDLANRTRQSHIITIEDPVEFLHTPKMSWITQREVGEDTESFGIGLRAALREAPDIILVGELRDLETTEAALTAAETGHLVFATMHTKSAGETVNRFVNQFPTGVRNQIQDVLASTLQAVVVQALLPTMDGKGRAPARELMILDTNIRALIRQHELEQISGALQTSGADSGNFTLNKDLARLVNEGRVGYEEALRMASDDKEFTAHARRRTIGRLA